MKTYRQQIDILESEAVKQISNAIPKQGIDFIEGATKLQRVKQDQSDTLDYFELQELPRHQETNINGFSHEYAVIRVYKDADGYATALLYQIDDNCYGDIEKRIIGALDYWTVFEIADTITENSAVPTIR